MSGSPNEILSASDPDLEVRLDSPLPDSLPPSSGNVLFCAGSCFHRELGVERITLSVQASEVEVLESNLPRKDVWEAARDDRGTPSGAYHSGFVADLPVNTPASGQVEIGLRAQLADGRTATANLGSVGVEVPDEPRPQDLPEARVGIAMATFDPDPELFADQVRSIQAQTLEDWVCVISDDNSPPATLDAIRQIVAGDDRFAVSPSTRRLGFYLNFERALRLLPPGVELIALSDQDDRWYPHKLATLVERLGDANLVYSDQRIVDRSGGVIAESFWAERRNNFEKLSSLVIANTVTGAASLMRRETVERALPFPRPPGDQYHDHWLALVARTTGSLAYVDEPLYEYVQHGESVLGYETANLAALAGGARGLLRHPVASARALARKGRAGLRIKLRDSLYRRSRVCYFNACCRLRLLSELLLGRNGDLMTASDRRVLERMRRIGHSPLTSAWLAVRYARALLGSTETLRAEGLLLRGLAWLRAVRLLSAGRSTPRSGLPVSAEPPRSQVTGTRFSKVQDPAARQLAQIVEPLQWSFSHDEPERINVLIPTIDLKHLFGGYIAKFNLARRMADRGARVRLVTVDETPKLPRDWKARVESFAGLEGLFDQVEIAFGRDGLGPVPANPRDGLVATAWKTAHIANAALGSTERDRFLYLIQEYEPFTFPMGSLSALAMETYEMPHTALFSTELLRDFFRLHGYGVFGHGAELGDATSASFQNAITDVRPDPSLTERTTRRLLFYARPEAHAERNMYDLGVLALSQAVSDQVFEGPWEFLGIGSVGEALRIRLGAVANLEVEPRRNQDDYARLLASCDVGLSLMLTPHPSLVPIEMAAAGMATVTNTFENKTPEALQGISTNLIGAAPTAAGIVEGLREAAECAKDPAARIAGSEVAWSRSWAESLPDDLVDRLLGLLRGNR